MAFLATVALIASWSSSQKLSHASVEVCTDTRSGMIYTLIDDSVLYRYTLDAKGNYKRTALFYASELLASEKRPLRLGFSPLLGVLIASRASVFALLEGKLVKIAQPRSPIWQMTREGVVEFGTPGRPNWAIGFPGANGYTWRRTAARYTGYLVTRPESDMALYWNSFYGDNLIFSSSWELSKRMGWFRPNSEVLSPRSTSEEIQPDWLVRAWRLPGVWSAYSRPERSAEPKLGERFGENYRETVLLISEQDPQKTRTLLAKQRATVLWVDKVKDRMVVIERDPRSIESGTYSRGLRIGYAHRGRFTVCLTLPDNHRNGLLEPIVRLGPATVGIATTQGLSHIVNLESFRARPGHTW
jgi:hypothetical protein